MPHGVGNLIRTPASSRPQTWMKTFLTPEKMFGPVHRHRIDWDAPVAG